jgi:hypothetical protein
VGRHDRLRTARLWNAQPAANKVALVCKKMGNLRESTVRYLGIKVDDALALSEQVDL